MGPITVALFSRRSVQAGYVVSLLVLVPGAVVLARRAGWRPGRVAVAAAGAAALALFPALTLARRGIALRFPTCEVLLRSGLEPATAEQLLNLVLLVPAGFLFGLALRRAWPVVLGALVLSVGAESVQAVLGIGYCQTLDVARNVAGAFLAGLFGAVLGRALVRVSHLSVSHGPM